MLFLIHFVFYCAGRHKGPTANKSTKTLNKAFEAFPEAIDPLLSKTNQVKIPINTVLRTASGALSYTQTDNNQIITPQTEVRGN